MSLCANPRKRQHMLTGTAARRLRCRGDAIGPRYARTVITRSTHTNRSDHTGGLCVPIS